MGKYIGLGLFEGFLVLAILLIVIVLYCLHNKVFFQKSSTETIDLHLYKNFEREINNDYLPKFSKLLEVHLKLEKQINQGLVYRIIGQNNFFIIFYKSGVVCIKNSNGEIPAGVYRTKDLKKFDLTIESICENICSHFQNENKKLIA